MAAYNLEEQEQLAELKAWWKQYGNLLTNVLLAAALIALAWRGWGWYQDTQAGQASAVFAVLQKAAEAKDSSRIKAASGELIEKFGRTEYAALGALTSAKAMLETGDAKSAKAQLTWVAEHGKDELRDLARLRVASLLLDEKAYDEALRQLDGSATPSFVPRFQDARGDVLAAQGKKAEALQAYRSAQDSLSASDRASGARESQSKAIFRGIVRQKIDSLGGEGEKS